MITTRLNGGLGNQMFQYAVGRHLAEIHKTGLKMDISAFNGCKKRKYALFPFNIRDFFASPEEIATLRTQKKGAVPTLIRKLFNIPLKPAQTYVREKNLFQFDPAILHKTNGVYLDGSWQNEKYFKGIEELIRVEFIVKKPQIGRNKVFEEHISSCESVNLHIRRGDYVSESGTRSFHGLCELDYYYHAVELLTRKVSNPHFFVFSDEREWVHKNLNLHSPMTLVDNNGTDEAHLDMHLMSMCKYHIIANSSFSWWGAWLGKSSRKIVIYPRDWLRSDVHDTTDLTPKGWIEL